MKTEKAIVMAAMAAYKKRCKKHGSERAFLENARKDFNFGYIVKEAFALIEACAAHAKAMRAAPAKRRSDER